MQKCEKLVKQEMKMLHCTRFHLSMFIVLSLCQAYDAPYRSFPSMKEFIRDQGETLLILYEERTLLRFVYPDSIGKSTNTSNHSISYHMENGVYNYIFTRQNTVFGDTGWYGCARHNFDTSINSDDSEMDWLYVYVRSSTNLFVEAHTNVHLSAIAGGSIVIPCRTTWPDLKPILIIGNKDELNNVPFDPKVGFTIRNLSLEDSNRYKCLIEKDGKVHAVSYVLSVLKQVLPEPEIQVNDLFITRGQELKINCTIEMKLYISMEYKFDWNMPQQNNNRRSTQQFIKHLDENIVRITSQLTIFNVTDEDEGNYECITKSIYYIKKIKKNIRINDPRIKHIEFLPESDTLYFQRKAGNDFQLTVYVFSFLDTCVEWLYPDGVSIKKHPTDINTGVIEYCDTNGLNSSKKTVSSLRIIDLKLRHSAIYTIQAKNGYTIEIMNFTLNVIGKPNDVRMKPIASYYSSNESAEFHCLVTCNPPPNMTWRFLKCPNYPTLENSSMVYLTNVTESADHSIYHYESIITMLTEISGMIICEACNNFGCDSVTENIIVSDPPFFVKTNMNKTKVRTVDIIAEGNNTVILQCFAKGTPKPEVTWYKDNVTLKKNDQYDFGHDHQELHIKYLNLYDSGNYSCRANNSIGINDTYQQITVIYTKYWLTLGITLVISIFIVGFILVILEIFFMRRYHVQTMRRGSRVVDLMHPILEEQALKGCLNPNLTVDEQAEFLSCVKKWEFPKARLLLKEQLGSGNFGVVMKAEAIGIHKNENVTTVAVKMIRRTTNPDHIRIFVNELRIMMHLDKHLNIVNLLGACTENISKGELLVIFEYCRFGNLHNYLLRHRNNFINQINPKTGKHDFTIGMDILSRTSNDNIDNSLHADADIEAVTQYSPGTSSDSPKANSLPDCINGSSSPSESGPNCCNDNKNHKPICTKDLLSWAFQVARGMEYLSQRKILHGDLAARNILLAENNIVKICNFALAKTMYKDGNYKKESNDPTPVKWMAIESIRDRIFSTQSDVWSFGVMLWEFFTLAERPYLGVQVEEQPDYAVDEVYDVMLQCWITEPTLRPSFTELVEMVGNLLEEGARMDYITPNNSYMDNNTTNLKNDMEDSGVTKPAPGHTVLSLATDKSANSTVLNGNSDLSDLNMSCPTDESKVFIPRQDDSIRVKGVHGMARLARSHCIKAYGGSLPESDQCSRTKSRVRTPKISDEKSENGQID